jgi:hypothetical protein
MPIVVLVALVGATILAQAPTQSPIRPGRWEVTMQMQMPNVPVQMPEMKTTQCVTPEQARDPEAALPRGPQGGNAKQDCKVSDFKQSGNTVTWQMACTSPQPVTATGEMTFTDDTYAGMMKMNTPQGDMSMKVAGKRLGDCAQ